MFWNLSDHQLKIDFYKHSLLYMNPMVTTTQQVIMDKQKQRRNPNKPLQKVIDVQEERAREKRNREELQIYS